MEKLLKPYTKEQKYNFIITYNHQRGLKIEETDLALYALEKWETLIGEEVIENKEQWEQEQIEAKKAQFNKDFFKTSLGYIRRKVSMATGETKDFLSDLLPTISMGVQMWQPVTIIVYSEPDFSQEIVNWEALQSKQTVTAEFVQECFTQLSNDFKPIVPEVENVEEN